MSFLHYPDISHLDANQPDLPPWNPPGKYMRFFSSSSGTTCHEGTPDIHGMMNSDGTTFSFGFHYNFDCTTDREAFGTLTSWSTGTATMDTVRDNAVTAAGYGGKHGGRDDITWHGYRFSLQEASTNVADDSTFRFVLYDYSNDTAYPAPITNSVKSACHGNPRIVQATGPSGPVLVVIFWIFPSSPCAVPGEGGEGLYTVPAG